MDRAKCIFRNEEIEAFCQEHMNNLIPEVKNYIKELISAPGDTLENIYNVFYLGLYTGMVNGICVFSQDEITGIPTDDQNENNGCGSID